MKASQRGLSKFLVSLQVARTEEEIGITILEFLRSHFYAVGSEPVIQNIDT